MPFQTIDQWQISLRKLDHGGKASFVTHASQWVLRQAQNMDPVVPVPFFSSFFFNEQKYWRYRLTTQLMYNCCLYTRLSGQV